MSLASGIYQGVIRHRRYVQGPREFSYSLFMMYLDLDELDKVFTQSRWWSIGKRNVAWLRRNDYIGPHDVSIADAVRAKVLADSGQVINGPIRMLSHLRYWGHCFNPVTVYYCFSSGGERVETVVAEINNTPWNERHAYVLSKDASSGSSDKLRATLEKNFHVSPFWPMDHQYHWNFSTPKESLVIHMENRKDAELLFDATLSLKRREATTANLNKMLLLYPGMTIKVVGAIYWQALRLRLGGAKFFPHPGRENSTKGDPS